LKTGGKLRLNFGDLVLPLPLGRGVPIAAAEERVCRGVRILLEYDSFASGIVGDKLLGFVISDNSRVGVFISFHCIHPPL
jgi:hypothetical protein